MINDFKLPKHDFKNSLEPGLPKIKHYRNWWLKERLVNSFPSPFFPQVVYLFTNIHKL